METNNFKIIYNGMSVKGDVRKNNEDNIFCDGKSRKAEDNEDFSIQGEILSRDQKLVAVFDGMGGIEKGEIASMLASKTAGEFNFKTDEVPKEKMHSFIRKMNKRVLQCAVENEVENMGTTFAGVLFDREKICIGNVGDSKIFRVRSGKIEQLSQDHVLPKELAFRNIITQYVGMDETAKELNPKVEDEEYVAGDRYIICSDGLTENLNSQEVGVLCHVAQTVSDATDILISQALGQGGGDNITVIVCEIREMNS